MKNKSKLVLFAAAVLRALLLIVPVSALAAAEADQEIGAPQAMEVPVKGCFGAVLSPDDDRFYTVREGFLTQYQIKPFKKIGSIAIIDWERITKTEFITVPAGKFEVGVGKGCRVLMTNDKSKLIIIDRYRMFLLDARSGQVLNKYERTGFARAIDAAVLNNNDLVILETLDDGNGPRFFNLTIWDAETLKLKRDIHDVGTRFGFVASGGPFPGMSKIWDRIYMTSGSSVVVLNSKTYAPELTLKTRSDFHLPFFGNKISKNFQKLYVGKVSEVTDHLTGKHTKYDEFKFSSVLVFDQVTREFRIENINNILREGFDPALVSPGLLSRNKDYVMMSYTSKVILTKLNSDVPFRFNQYESGEAILLSRYKYFHSTPDARKYLMMKNSAGKTVPINDATFDKYNRTESSH